MRKLQTGMPAPWLEVSSLTDNTWRLADQKPQSFTMVAFYRGLHCPLCCDQLTKLDAKVDEFRAIGVDVIAISGDSKERAQRSQKEWSLERLSLGYANSIIAMQRWGLYISRGAYENEPLLFNEPATFLIRPDGILYAAVIASTPFSRPHADDLLSGISYVVEHNYPVRGAET